MINQSKIDIEPFSKKEIPKIPNVAGWKEVSIEPSKEPLVPLGLLSDFDIFTSSIYFSEHDNSPYAPGQLKGSLATIFLRRSVAVRLRDAQEMLPDGYRLIAFDGWRPLDVQKSLYDEYYGALKVKFPDWSEDGLSAETQKYVSLPSGDPKKPSPHNTGGSIDLAIIRLPENVASKLQFLPTKEENGAAERAKLILSFAKLLNFGTPFDWGGSEAALRHFEELAQKRALDDAEKEARANRRILYHLMRAVDMEPYQDEWWHYNAPESQMGAKTAGLNKAYYGSADISEQDFNFEMSRRALAERIGRRTILPQAAIIKPPQDI